MKMEIRILGTSSAIPTPKRNHPGILVSFGSEQILIDCGEGTQRQLKIAEINPCKLTRVLITHWHADHTLGLIGLMQTLNMSGYSKTLQIYGPKGTKRNMGLLEEIYGRSIIKNEIHEVSGKVVDKKDFQINSAEMSHGIPTNAYSIVIKDKLRLKKEKIKKLKIPNSPLLGKLQQGRDVIHPKTKKKIRASEVAYLEKGRKLTVIMDTLMNQKIIALSKGSDLIISESSFLESSKEGKEKSKAYRHLTAKQAGTIAKKSKSKLLLLTHLSRRYDSNPKEIEKEAKSIFENTRIARDLDKIII